jgi:hypothetical protein
MCDIYLGVEIHVEKWLMATTVAVHAEEANDEDQDRTKDEEKKKALRPLSLLLLPSSASHVRLG